MNSEPMTLAQLQREMARAVMMPLTRDEDMRRECAGWPCDAARWPPRSSLPTAN